MWRFVFFWTIYVRKATLTHNISNHRKRTFLNWFCWIAIVLTITGFHHWLCIWCQLSLILWQTITHSLQAYGHQVVNWVWAQYLAGSMLKLNQPSRETCRNSCCSNQKLYGAYAPTAIGFVQLCYLKFIADILRVHSQSYRAQPRTKS